ncbi:hypothetical protein ES703_79400 [subsurface metagenome]
MGAVIFRVAKRNCRSAELFFRIVLAFSAPALPGSRAKLVSLYKLSSATNSAKTSGNFASITEIFARNNNLLLIRGLINGSESVSRSLTNRYFAVRLFKNCLMRLGFSVNAAPINCTIFVTSSSDIFSVSRIRPNKSAM